LAQHNEIGKKGEKLAAQYLRKNGYTIISVNWRSMHKEIDIIARDGDTLVIVEVKLRSSEYFREPYEAVTKKKQRLLIEAAEAYLETIDEAPEVRFDIISITGSDDGYKYELITEAFVP